MKSLLRKISDRLFPLLLLGGVAVAACDEKDIDQFDADRHLIYIDIPYELDAFGHETTRRADSICYSFALDGPEVTDTIIPVVIKVSSLPADHDRPYRIGLVDGQTTATSADWDAGILENRCIKAGALTDTLKIPIRRNENLRQHWVQLRLRLSPNEEFQLGYSNLHEVKVSFSDILNMPSWWPRWESVFGEFVREKYQKWIEIYPLGADQTLSFENGEPLYWDNMPATPVADWYPILFMHVRILRDYFIEHEVYPDGDTSRPRITIPYLQ